MTTVSRCSVKIFAVGVAVAGAVLAYAPMASAQPVPGPVFDCSPLEEGDSPRIPEHQQECDARQQQQQQKQPAMPDIPDLPQNKPADNPNGVDLADKNCWVYRGVPTMWSPALVSGPGEQVWPCYYVYGLTPH